MTYFLRTVIGLALLLGGAVVVRVTLGATRPMRERILDGVRRARAEAGVDRPAGLDDVKHFSWSPANPTASEWSILLDVTAAG